MQIGVHGLVFTGTFDEKGLNVAASGASAASFDLLEIPLMDPFAFDPNLVGRILSDNELSMSASLGLTPETDLSSDDKAVAKRGEDLLTRAIEVVSESGGSSLCGVIYSALTKYSQPVTPQGYRNSAAALNRLGETARQAGVELTLEVVNRYETNIINTARQGLSFLNEIAHENVHLHLDSYHMNIEESSMFEPILEAGSRVRYVHIGESHRGYLGTGTVDFDSMFRALALINYDGPMVFESFSNTVVSDELSNTLGVWRNLWQSSADLASHANRFMNDKIRAVKSIEDH